MRCGTQEYVSSLFAIDIPSLWDSRQKKARGLVVAYKTSG
jgi:hypothetical protein